MQSKKSSRVKKHRGWFETTEKVWMDVTSCPQCGCPFPGNYKSTTQSVTPKKKGLGLLGTVVAFVIAGLNLWYLIAPLWLQHIGGTIKALLTDEQNYTVFDPSKLVK